MHENHSVDVRLQLLTIVMIAVSSLGVDLAFALPGEPLWPPLCLWAALLLVVLAFNWWLRRQPDKLPKKVTTPFFIVLAVLPFLPIPLSLSESPSMPLELKMLSAFRNLGLAMATMSMRPLFLRLAGLISLFLVLFSASLSQENWTGLIIGCYSGLGGLWLMLVYWQGLPGASGARKLVFPWTAVLLLVLVLGGIGAAVTFGTRESTRILWELMPTSGGTTWFDPNARSGVGDGDDEVAGENPESVGFVQSDIMLEDDGPTLYDVSSDMYGEPFKIKKQERAIPLSFKNVRDLGKKPSENLRASRKFPTLRNPPNKRFNPESKSTKALMFVAGRTPLHLRMEIYDKFDGISLLPADENSNADTIRTTAKKTVFAIALLRHDYYCRGRERHVLKLARLKTPRLPTPGQLEKFQLGQVNRLDFFTQVQGDILALSSRDVPPGEVLSVISGIPDRETWQSQKFTPPQEIGNSEKEDMDRLLPIPSAISALAKSWTVGLPRGREQIEAIENKLREGYQHDVTAVAPKGCANPMEHFLLKSKRGPDYMFAVSAALLLRSLDYPVRVVNGFYVDPAKFDYKTQHTSVFREDMHFWCEVQASQGCWLVVEPTPGYEVRQPILTFWERCGKMAATLWNCICDNWLSLSVLVIACFGLFLYRRHVFDFLATQYWHFAGRHNERACLFCTIRLLERRYRWAGKNRPIGTTLARWLRSLSETREGDVLYQLAALADRALYQPTAKDNAGTETVSHVCREVVREWTIQRFKKGA